MVHGTGNSPLTDAVDGFLAGHRVLICDRDSKWTEGFRRIVQGAGVRIVMTPVRLNGGPLQDLQLRFPAHEGREPTSRRAVELAVQGTRTDELLDAVAHDLVHPPS